MSVPKECPKCGRFAKGLYGEDSWAHGPRYINNTARLGLTLGNVTEWLEYVCKQCGYVHYEPTRDSEAKETP